MKQYKPKIKRRVITLDIEGYRDYSRNKIVPYLLGLYDGNDVIILDSENCIKEFIKYFLNKKYRGVIFASHFGSIFDFSLLLEEIDKIQKFRIYPINQGSKIIKITIVDSGDRRFFLHDTSALLNFSLDSLSKAFNVAHKKLKIIEKNDDYDILLYKKYKENPGLVKKYLAYDCISLYEILEKFKENILNMNGVMGLTTASTSLKTFKKSFQKRDIPLNSKNMNNEMRNAYFGGRTEIFRMYAPEIQGQYYFYYDVNSLYPFVMRNNEYPVSKPNIIKYPSINDICESVGITKAKVKVPNKEYIPLLPSKIKMDYSNKLLFTTGKISGYWDNSLLKEAKDLGYKIEGFKSFTFESENIFKDYVDQFYKIKQNSEKDTPMYLLSKLFMNSLYGKFGQRQESELIIKDNDPDILLYKIKDHIDFEKGWVKVSQQGKGKFYLPQISIHVIALAQLYLFRTIQLILDKGYNVYYCDTDSITTDYPNLPVSNNIGKWKLEKKILEGSFLLPKTYKIVNDDRTVNFRVKGFNRSLQNKIQDNAFEKALKDNDYSGFKVISEKKELIRIRSCHHRFKEFNKLDYIKKSIKTRYNKRKIIEDFNTRAFNINEVIN